MNINTEIEKATQEYLESEKLKEHIKTKAETMVNELIDDSFGYFGGIKKSVEEAINDEIKINVKELGLSGFNKFITEIVKDKINNSMRVEASAKISSEIDKILNPMEKLITIEKLKEELFAEAGTYDLDVCGDPTLRDLQEMNYDEDDIFTFIVDEPSEDRYNWVTIRMDAEINKSNYECKYEITVHEDFCTFKIHNQPLQAKDKVFGYKHDVEDLMYSMFLNDSVIDLVEARKYV